MIQDTLCQLQNINLENYDITMPEFEIPRPQEFQVDNKNLIKENVEKIVAEARIMEVLNELK